MFLFRCDLQIQRLVGLSRLHRQHLGGKHDRHVALCLLRGERGRYQARPHVCFAHGGSERQTMVSQRRLDPEPVSGQMGLNLCPAVQELLCLPPKAPLRAAGRGVPQGSACPAAGSSQKCCGHRGQSCALVRDTKW